MSCFFFTAVPTLMIENGATCTDEIAEYNCTCDNGFTGDNCSIDIDDCASEPCENGATCTDEITGYNCTCDN